eukprot:UN01154
MRLCATPHFFWKKTENCLKCCENNQKIFSRKISFVLSISAIENPYQRSFNK